jgi:Family of unknown function (DUF6172)
LRGFLFGLAQYAKLCIAATAPHRKPAMKKVYPLQAEGKHPDRLLEATKHDIRKYIKRCRSTPLPAGVDFWDFDCKLGADKDTALPVHLAEITTLLDAAAKEGRATVYVEIFPKNGLRTYKPVDATAANDAQG